MNLLCTYVPLEGQKPLIRPCISYEETFTEIRYMKVHRYITCLARAQFVFIRRIIISDFVYDRRQIRVATYPHIWGLPLERFTGQMLSWSIANPVERKIEALEGKWQGRGKDALGMSENG